MSAPIEPTFSEEIPVIHCDRASCVLAPIVPSGHMHCIEGAQVCEEGQAVVVKNCCLTIVDDAEPKNDIPERLTQSICFGFLGEPENLIMSTDEDRLGFQEAIVPPVCKFSSIAETSETNSVNLWISESELSHLSNSEDLDEFIETTANPENGEFEIDGQAVTVKNSFLNIIEDEEPLVEVPDRLTQSCICNLDKPSMSDIPEILSSRKFSTITESTHESMDLRSIDLWFSTPSSSQLELEASQEVDYAVFAEMPVYQPTEHECGECNPCAFAMKAGGCTKGDACGYCHEEHTQEYFKFSQKRNRAKCMALKHGDAPRFDMSWAQYCAEGCC